MAANDGKSPAPAGVRLELTMAEREEIKLYTVADLAEKHGVLVAFTTRVTGVSSGVYSSLNLGDNTSDLPENITENRRRLSAALGLWEAPLVTANQVHGARALLVNYQPREPDPASLPDADGLLTRAEMLPLALFFADCLPVVLVDVSNRAVGLAHAGWRGTQAGVAQATFLKMQAVFGTKPAKTWVFFGPSIGSCCYKVGDDLARRFATDYPGAVSDDRLDLEQANRIALAALGVSRDNMASAGLCTCCNPNLFYSYRRDGETGRQAALVALERR